MSERRKFDLPYLEVYMPDGRIDIFELVEHRVVVGRMPGVDIRIDDDNISRRHAKMKRIDRGRWMVKDYGSRNKTFFNHLPILWRVLNNGDVFYLSTIKVVFHDPTGLSDIPVDHTAYQDQETQEQTFAELVLDTESVSSSFSGRSELAKSDRRALVRPIGAVDAVQPYEETPDQGGEFDNSSPISLAIIKRILQYKKMIAAIFILVAVPAVILVWTLVEPKFMAEAKIQVRPIIPKLVFTTEENGIIPLYDSYKNTQASILLSPRVLQRVLDQSVVKKTAWFRDGSALPIERLQKNLVVTPEKGSEIITVDMIYRKPDEAALILNTILDEYIKFSYENSSQTNDFVYRKIAEEIDSMTREIESLEKITSRLRKELGTGSPDELLTQKRMRLEEAQAKLDAIDQDIAVFQWQQKKLDGMMRQTSKPANFSDTSTAKYGYDLEWRSLYGELRMLKNQAEVDRQQFGEIHPRMRGLQKRILMAEETLKAREQLLDKRQTLAFADNGTGKAVDVDSLGHQLGVLKYRRDIVFASLKKQREDFAQTFNSAQMLVTENENINHRREIFNKVRTRLDEKEMEGKVPGSITIIAPAIVPSAPAKDKRIPFTFAVLFGSLAVGMGAAWFRVRMNPTIAGTDELPDTLRMPFLGELPLVSEEEAGSYDFLNQNENIRMVRTCLLHRIEGGHGNVILVTSADKGAGKTTLSIMLARSLAQTGKKVLLVDGDIYNPSLSRRFNVRQEPGLFAVLKGEVGDSEAIVETETAGLSVLPTGISQNGSRELLTNGSFKACLSRWRKNYDLVMLDSSPVLPVADARILSRHADGTIIVVREKHCQREDVVKTLACLGASGGKLLGLVYIGSKQNSRYGAYPYGGYPGNSYITGNHGNQKEV
ncbi:MAG: polysaccharide biosynthesis tyrosine autokinase [Phycisphaerae bacterium]